MCFPMAMIACHSQYGQSVCDSKSMKGMPHPTLCDCVSCQRAMMACHSQCRPNICASHSHCRLTVCCPRAIIAYHAQCRPTACAMQGLHRHATRDVVQSCVLSKGYEDTPRSTSSECVLSTIYDDMPCSTLLDPILSPSAMIEYHARCRRSCVQLSTLMPCHA